MYNMLVKSTIDISFSIGTNSVLSSLFASKLWTSYSLLLIILYCTFDGEYMNRLGFVVGVVLDFFFILGVILIT